MICHPFQLRFWPEKYLFEGKNMPYKTAQNSTWFDGWIKKSTFWPIMVLASIAIKRDFKCYNPLIHYPIMLYLFIFSLFGFETCNFAHCFFFFFFGICFYMWIEVRQNTVSTNVCTYLTYMCDWCIYIYIYERVYIYLLGFRFANSIIL